MLNVKLLKIQFMIFLSILKKESSILCYFTWGGFMLSIIGLQQLSKIKELWHLKLVLSSSESKLTINKWKESKLSLKRLNKSQIISWLFQVQLLTILEFWELKLRNIFVKLKSSKKMKQRIHSNVLYVTKSLAHANF